MPSARTPLTIESQRPLVLVPSMPIAEKATNKIMANMTEYSTAVAASSLLRNLAKERITNVPLSRTRQPKNEPPLGGSFY